MYSNTKRSAHLLYLNITKILFYIFPICFIVGNFAVSLNTLLFIIISLFVVKKKGLRLRFNNSNWFLIAFFLYFFLSTTFQYLTPGILNEKMIEQFPFEYDPILKSFLLVRFVLLILVVDTLFYNKLLDLKKFLFSSLLCTSFVCLDVILQYFSGTDLFGNKSFEQWNAGPFGDEFIAGGYIKNFSFFSFFYIFLISNNKKSYNLLFISIIVLHLLGALMTGNRMPLILFLFGCVLIILLIKNLRLVFIISLVIFIFSFSFLMKQDSWLKYTYKVLYGELNISKIFKSKEDLISAQNLELGHKEHEVSPEIRLLRHSGYNRVWRTSVIMWKQNPIFGSGLKSFRIKCWEILGDDTLKNLDYYKREKSQNVACGTHPHSYYLHILSEAGIIGSVLLILFFSFLFKDSFLYIKKFNQKINPEITMIIPFVISFILEIWPIRSSGSFFTTWNASFIWLVVAVLIANKYILKNNN